MRRAMAYATAHAVDERADMNLIRRMVSQSKKIITESCQKVVHNSMQSWAASAIRMFFLSNAFIGTFVWRRAGRASAK
jgi:alkylation response protein AidB-like acyl-CoA dehydrogenase